MKTKSERPTPPPPRHRTAPHLPPLYGRTTDRSRTEVSPAPNRAGFDSPQTNARNDLSRPSGRAPAPWIAARAATADIPRNYLIHARQRAPEADGDPNLASPPTQSRANRRPVAARAAEDHDVGADPGDERFPNRTNPVTAGPPHQASGIAPIAGSGAGGSAGGMSCLPRWPIRPRRRFGHLRSPLSALVDGRRGLGRCRIE